MTVKLVGKEISGPSGKFTTFAVLTANGNWYRVAKIDRAVLKPYQGEVVTIDVSRKFDKAIVTAAGEEKAMPTLVVEEVRLPDEKELAIFNAALDKINSESLKGVN